MPLTTRTLKQLDHPPQQHTLCLSPSQYIPSIQTMTSALHIRSSLITHTDTTFLMPNVSHHQLTIQCPLVPFFLPLVSRPQTP